MCSAKYDYSYLIAYLPENLADNIISWGYDNIPCDYLFEDQDDPSFGREKDIHITVLGDVTDTSLNNIRDAVNSEKTVDCCLGKMKLFVTNSKYDVLHLEIINEEVQKLNAKLSKSIINNPRFPLFIPHVTICYLKKGFGENYLDNKYFYNQSFSIKSLTFSHKYGERHNFELGKL
jgi:hypothetical protein